jgi:hypothetical protein
MVIPKSYWGSSFGIASVTNPCQMSASSNTQIFYAPLDIQIFQPTTAGEWGGFGQQVMPGQLLVAPGNGVMPQGAYAVAAGDVSTPAGTTNAFLQITLYQNVFTQVDETIQVESYAWATTAVELISGQTALWSISYPVGYAPSFGAGHNKPLQLSIGVKMNGSSSAAPHVRMMQFQLQQS